MRPRHVKRDMAKKKNQIWSLIKRLLWVWGRLGSSFLYNLSSLGLILKVLDLNCFDQIFFTLSHVIGDVAELLQEQGLAMAFNFNIARQTLIRELIKSVPRQFKWRHLCTAHRLHKLHRKTYFKPWQVHFFRLRQYLPLQISLGNWHNQFLCVHLNWNYLSIKFVCSN